MTFDNPHRRISRVAQPEVPSDSFGSLEETSKQVKRRISRVAFQELHQEEEQGGAWDGDKVSRAEKVVRKFSTYISMDGSNVEMMDPDISERTYTATVSSTDSLSLRPRH